MYSQPIICEMLSLADHATAYYYQKHPFSWKHPQPIDLDLLLMLLTGSNIKMWPLSKDGSVLGMTVHERLTIRMELEDGTVIRDTLLPKDIVVDSSLAGFHWTSTSPYALSLSRSSVPDRGRFC